jgi:hypothetical protein
LVFLLALAYLVSCARGNDKPEIEWFFACSDLCPEPMETYMRPVYKDVTDRESCLELGGLPGQLVGWGTHSYCVVQNDEELIETTDKKDRD